MVSPVKNSYHKLSILDGVELLNAHHHKLNFPFHTHQTFNITLVTDQLFSTKIADRLLYAQKKAIVITHPEEVHATICDSRIGSSFFTFYVPGDVLKMLNDNKPVSFDDRVIYDPLLFKQLYQLSINFENAAIHLEKKLLATLQQLVTSYASDNTATGKKNKLFQTFLAEETFEKFSLERTAAKFGLDKYKFLRLFKYETGLTPNNYIILKRIEKCKELLLTQDNLLDIAIQTGFYDATHLCKHFKRLTGIRPLDYRNA
jgi:AraC-like DNA-binding protein